VHPVGNFIKSTSRVGSNVTMHQWSRFGNCVRVATRHWASKRTNVLTVWARFDSVAYLTTSCVHGTVSPSGFHSLLSSISRRDARAIDKTWPKILLAGTNTSSITYRGWRRTGCLWYPAAWSTGSTRAPRRARWGAMREREKSSNILC